MNAVECIALVVSLTELPSDRNRSTDMHNADSAVLSGIDISGLGGLGNCWQVAFRLWSDYPGPRKICEVYVLMRSSGCVGWNDFRCTRDCLFLSICNHVIKKLHLTDGGDWWRR